MTIQPNTAESRHRYRPIGVNRTGQMVCMQIRPYAPQADRAIHWITFAATPFNATVPFFANVDAMPDYVSNTTPEVTLDSYYWASRFLAVLGDSDYSGTAEPIAYYKQTVAALGHQMVFATDVSVAKTRATPPPANARTSRRRCPPTWSR